jgi:DNA-binding beta-propeller fold protein YncE
MMPYRNIALGVATLATIGVFDFCMATEHRNSAHNPYRLVENWAQLHEPRSWGQVIGVEIDSDGKSVWVLDRCGGGMCNNSNLAPIQKFDASGNLVSSFGAGLFNWPHGLFIDRGGNVWATDGIGIDRKGQTVTKFSPNGKVLMTLGQPGSAGSGHDTFNGPSDVLVAPNGDVFVADGHGPGTNARIVKFDSDGHYIKEWGREGAAPGQFDVPHGLAMDSDGRLFVADRSNNRIQIFDQDGRFIAQLKQFGRPSGIYIDKNDVLYVADSQSDEKFNPGVQQGIRIGSARDGNVTGFIAVDGPESVAADDRGEIYCGFIAKQTLEKFVKY